MVNAPEVSGGAGFTFADRAAAIYLCALLGQQQAPGLPGRRIVRVALEQANFGEPLDDLVADGTGADGSIARLSLQVKRELTVSAAASNADFREIVSRGAKTLRKPTFREGIDRVGVVTGTIAARSKRALTEVCEIARASTSDLHFFQRFDAGGGAGQDRRDIVNVFRTILAQSPCGTAGDDVLYRVLRHFVVIEFDSMHEGATADPMAIAWLSAVLDVEDADRACDLWNLLLVIAREGAGRSANFDSAGLISRLHGTFRLQRVSPTGRVLQPAAPVRGTAIAADAEIVSRARTAAAADLAAFKRSPGWPLYPIALGLSIKGHPQGRVLNIEDLLRVPEPRRELCIVSPPGTGKTTMLLQSADALLASGDEIAIFVPLNEWSTGNRGILDSILGRLAFSTFRLEDLQLVAQAGRLALLLDGWNELDSASRRRATTEVRKLRRELPLLRIIISTRQQATDVPISGPTGGVQPLSWAQQLEIARGIAGDAGVTLLDKARRTSGVRELVSIPLYLTVLLKLPGGEMPTTKEELLRLFAAEHERSSDQADALRDYFQGCHKDLLVALGVEATVTGTAALSERHARTVVSLAGDRLIASGQIAEKPSPSLLLDALVGRHTLVRSGSAEQATLSFQHQQFQEWYASFEVQDLMTAASTGNRPAADRLRMNVLDVPSWEESILFACERMSRAGESSVDAVAATIIGVLSIDPMLAAEMIYRSSAAVWDKVDGEIVTFVNRWHTMGTVDRAVRFMVTTGKSEFASLIWPLIAAPDDQIHITTLRAADRFRPGVLGKDARERLMALPDELRETVLGEIAHNSGIEGMELAADVARSDANPKVQFSVFEALQFRRSDRLVKDVLQAASPAVWSFLVERGYAGEMTDPDIAARLRAEAQSVIEKETDPLRRLRMLLHSDGESAEIGSQIEVLIAAADFPFKEQNAYPNVYEAFKSHPREVTSALRQRLEAGLELPSHSNEFLAGTPLVDKGPIVNIATDLEKPQSIACAAARIIGPNSIATLIGAFLLLQQQGSGGTWSVGEVEKFHNLRDRIRLTQQEAFIAAWLRLSETSDSATIATLCELVAMHGRDTGEIGFPPITGTHRSKLAAACQRMAEALLASSRSTRHDFEKMAQAIGRVASPELTDVLGRLLAEDLERWRVAREARSRQLATVTLTAGSDATISYTQQYASAFAAIGGDDAIELMKGYLADPVFGYDAAAALKEIWDNQHGRPANNLSFRGPDFAAVKARREERGAGLEQPSPIGEAIFAVVEKLAESGRSESDHGQALRLARIAFSMPYAGRSGLIAKLLKLSLPIEAKLDLLRVLVLMGEVVSADLALEGIRDFLRPAEGKFWSVEQRKWVLQRWLELLPFSDRPSATLDALEIVPPDLRRGWEVRGLLSALTHSPDPESERILAEMARRDPSLLGDYQWVSAVIGRGTRSACLMILDLRCDEKLARSSIKLDTWTISTELAALVTKFPDLREELIRRYQNLELTPCHSLIEQILAKNPDSGTVLAIIQSYAAKNEGFNGSLRFAIEETVLEKRWVSPSSGSYELHPIAVPNLRKQLFEITTGEGALARVASACLTTIDELHDEHGRAASERRHPDIESGRPWPPEAVVCNQ